MKKFYILILSFFTALLSACVSGQGGVEINGERYSMQRTEAAGSGMRYTFRATENTNSFFLVETYEFHEGEGHVAYETDWLAKERGYRIDDCEIEDKVSGDLSYHACEYRDQRAHVIYMFDDGNIAIGVVKVFLVRGRVLTPEEEEQIVQSLNDLKS